MALPLERKIMAEIGLEGHYCRINGSDTCKYLRERAAEQLEAAIERNHTFHREEIAEPEEELIRIVQTIAKNESPNSMLTDTWVAASEVIAAHIHAARIYGEERDRIYEKIKAYLTRRYLKYIKQDQKKKSSKAK